MATPILLQQTHGDPQRPAAHSSHQAASNVRFIEDDLGRRIALQANCLPTDAPLNLQEMRSAPNLVNRCVDGMTQSETRAMVSGYLLAQDAEVAKQVRLFHSAGSIGFHPQEQAELATQHGSRVGQYGPTVSHGRSAARGARQDRRLTHDSGSNPERDAGARIVSAPLPSDPSVPLSEDFGPRTRNRSLQNGLGRHVVNEIASEESDNVVPGAGRSNLPSAAGQARRHTTSSSRRPIKIYNENITTPTGDDRTVAREETADPIRSGSNSRIALENKSTNAAPRYRSSQSSRYPSDRKTLGETERPPRSHENDGDSSASQPDEEEVDGSDVVEESDEDVLEELTLSDAKSALCEALNGIEAAGNFATFGALKQRSDPRISLDAHGAIQLPLTAADAARIIAKSHQAPFGHGTQTIVDPAVRRTWELNPEQFYVTNPAFWQVQQEALHAACHGLGIEGGDAIEAQLYKLLLYEKGALFRPHTDTEKTPGMFGTLVICLPSAHEGGMLELSHGGSVMRFSSAAKQPAFGAWYSDVTHEVKEVTSGHRLVLTYNLVQTVRNANFSATSLGYRLAPVGTALRQGSAACSDEGSEDPAIYMLEHKYTDASVHLRTLKGADLARAQAIQHFAHDQGLVLYLASMER
ncbi:hypothetical protein LTR85_003253 [Meristemomyces frigidus]|nr:hypothetical protein LTR85_003253 [Meristemomyces frigidus]